jgi:hypothetical protein
MNLIKKLYSKVVLWIGTIHWAPKRLLTVEQQDDIKKLLKLNYFVILTHRSNHLSSYFIGLANFLLTGKWGYWTHALMNLEDVVTTDDDFRLIEAIGKGVEITPFDKVFDVQGVVLLKPKYMPIEDWTLALDKARTELGKPYDTLFDLKSDQSLSCVELVRTALMATPNYEQNFASFEAMIKKEKNLTPQMFFECDDFEIMYLVKRW